MALKLPRGARRALRGLKGAKIGPGEVLGYINANPLTSAVVAMAAGVVATSVFKMTVGKPAAWGAKKPSVMTPAAKKTVRK